MQRITDRRCLFLFVLYSLLAGYAAGQCYVLQPKQYEAYVTRFNAQDVELYQQAYPNQMAWAFLVHNIPFFDCPDKALEETYYFRWWTFRKHIKKTPAGFVLTEFLPSVSWSGKYNTISCALGHHFYEGRWLRNPEILRDYMHFWLDSAGEQLRNYSSWLADAWLAFTRVHPEVVTTRSMLDQFINNDRLWAQTHLDSTRQLYWQVDGADGMEVSAGGQMANGGQPAHNYTAMRPTLNSYLYGDAVAIALMAARLGDTALAAKYRRSAAHLKQMVEQQLWSDSLQFFGSIPYRPEKPVQSLLPVRELIGFIPWYFGLPTDNPRYTAAWQQLLDPRGFQAPYGPTTCEQRSPYFQIAYSGHECQWNGPSWPYATAQTLTAMARVLQDYHQSVVTRADYYTLLVQYGRSQRRLTPQGILPWIDENLNPYTGDWIARTRLKTWSGGSWPADKGGRERGKDYNHSTFCDLVISGLIGIRPQLNDTLVVQPLLPSAAWDYFCLDNLAYHGRTLTLLFDKTGTRYHKGKGFRIYVDGELYFQGPELRKVVVPLPS